MEILKLFDHATQTWKSVPAIKGEDGDPGVWYGSTTPPAGYTVWINPSGDILHDYQAPETFTATRSSSFSGGALNGSYDPFTRTVRIWLWCSATSNVAASVALFTGIPEKYRPSVAVSGAAFCISGAPSYYPYAVVVQPAGSVTQGSTNAFRGCFGYVEYTVGG